MNSNTTYIESLACELNQLQKLYIDELYLINLKEISKEEFAKKRKKYSLSILDTTSPIHGLYGKIVDYWEGKREMVREIKLNKLAGNSNYFAYYKHVFLDQYVFFENEFPDIIEDFIENESHCRHLVENFEFHPERLSDEDFLKGAKFQLVQIFRWLEELYSLRNPEYDPLLLGTNYLQGLPSKLNYIRLRYGVEKNNEVIKLIHNSLNGIYFNVSYHSFKKHFHSPSPFKKITWLGNSSSLVLLFHGKNLPRILGIKTLNSNKAKMLADHFVQSDGKEFNEQSLGSLPQNINQYETQGTTEIIALLKEIEKYQKI